MKTRIGLTPRSADRLKQILADGGSAGGRAAAGAAARGVTWVKVTGAPSGGWHPAVVALDDAGTLTDGTDVVHVAAADASADLVTGRHYMCTRTGDDADGTARFRAEAAETFTCTVLTDVTATATCNTDGTISITLTKTTKTLTVTGQGLRGSLV